MSGHYIVSDQADQDLLDIAFYLARYGVDVADRFIDDLHEKFQTLAEFPLMGRSREEFPRSAEFRRSEIHHLLPNR
jgi:plasmid stabilization system protein ParE